MTLYIINLVIFITNIYYALKGDNIHAVLGWLCAFIWVINAMNLEGMI